eukprot:1245639-Prymnesium_polylepis.1
MAGAHPQVLGFDGRPPRQHIVADELVVGSACPADGAREEEGGGVPGRPQVSNRADLLQDAGHGGGSARMVTQQDDAGVPEPLLLQ